MHFCPACGSTKVNKQFIKGNNIYIQYYVPPAPFGYLRLTCSECGYSWTEPAGTQIVWTQPNQNNPAMYNS